MTINELPEGFTKRMKELLGEEYEAFAASYEVPRSFSLRINPRKVSREEFADLSARAGWEVTPVSWEENGFYYREEDRPGRHPYHEAGMYYIQEASAMSAASLGRAIPGERVLDLCAAPGGKSTQLAAAMQGEGLLVCNEIHPARAKILSQNVERMGIRNAVVTNETPEHLADMFPSFFHRILVDAPCSGEGMFRKEEEAIRQWSRELEMSCALRQLSILEEGNRMLMPGGTLVYSTCTFAPEENEETIALFLAQHPEYDLAELSLPEGFLEGRSDWLGDRCSMVSDEVRAKLARTRRLFPHKLRGEGHFLAVLKKAGERAPLEQEHAKMCVTALSENSKRNSSESRKTAQKRQGAFKGQNSDNSLREALKLYDAFETEFLNCKLWGVPVLFGDELSVLPRGIPMKGLKILRPGLHLGTILKNRFEPSHALALALRPEEVISAVKLAPEEAERYIRGETLELSKDAADFKGWVLVCTGDCSIGWGKAVGGRLKNHYPKGLRK